MGLFQKRRGNEDFVSNITVLKILCICHKSVSKIDDAATVPKLRLEKSYELIQFLDVLYMICDCRLLQCIVFIKCQKRKKSAQHLMQ
jgi:hypothetical protein